MTKLLKKETNMKFNATFLDFLSIISAIPLQWKRVVSNPQIQIKIIKKS